MKHIVLTIFVFGALASYAFAQAPQPYQGSKCPPPVPWCPKQGQGTTTAYCANQDCFDVNVSSESEIKVVADDESGDFPKTWFVWHKGVMTQAGSSPCDFKKKSKSHGKTPVNIPDTKCRVDVKTNGHLYHEHFLSNPDPTKKCLGWVECKQY